MKSHLLVAILVATTSIATPLSAQGSTAKPQKRAPSPVKVEMEKLEEAIDAVGDFLKTPEGDAPMKEIAAAQESLMKAKTHAPRATQKQPEDKQAEFVTSYKIAINKTLRGVLDLEDAMLKKDYKAAEAVMAELKKMEKSGHRTFKPRRRRRSSGK